ncbi:hypothetical protein DL98DRAFT_511538 [Cadophora sp. DSE1049]|nr:hypothetical protein DL98DRAFT_511538 [Cadophora sp. DSE1049]
MTSRKPHTKSRNGCGQCKRRKVKCDERGPKCSNCSKWRDLCDYELFGLPTCSPAGKRKASSDSQSSGKKRSSPTPPAPVPSLPDMNLEHLELMHHYSIHTSRTFHTFNDGRWDILIPSQAASHEFLMHALLGVSALHIFHLKGKYGDPSSNQYLSRAHVHHAEALTLFRSTVRDITPANGTATAAFSCLFLIFSCGTAHLPSTEQGQDQDPVEALFIILRYFRSYRKLFVAAEIETWIGNLSPSPSHHPAILPGPSYTPNPGAMSALDDLLHTNTMSTDSYVHKAIYHDTIIQMQRSLDCGSSLPRIIWPLSISDEYLALLEQRRDMALIILAHGCNLIMEMPYRWYVHDWIWRMTSAVTEQIDGEWRESMRWPMVRCGVSLDGEEELGEDAVVFIQDM